MSSLDRRILDLVGTLELTRVSRLDLPRMSLDRLPIELHTIIFELVCSADMDTDVPSYHTARSLCLVSRRIYSITIPIMYKMLLVDGRTKASLLSRTLRCRPELGQCAQHLFLSDHSRHPRSIADDDTLEVLPAFAFEYPGSRERRIERLQRMEAWLTERERALTAFRCSVREILGAVSLYLHTLSICLYGIYDDKNDSGLAEALKHPFPSLVKLTIRDNVQPLPSSRLGLPALRHLLLAGGTSPSPFNTLGLLTEGCPNLTCIHLTEPFINGEAVSTLEQYLSGVTHSQSKSARRSSMLTETLRRLVLESSLSCSTPILKDALDRLSALSKQSSIFDFVRPQAQLGRGGPKRDVRYPLDEALRDWTDRITGRRERWRNKSPSSREAATIHP